MKLNRRYLTAATIAFLLPVCVVAVGDDNADTSKKEAIQEAAKEWGNAIQDKDKMAMSRMLTDDFLLVGPDGKVAGKEATIEFLAADNITINLEERDNEKIRVYGESAVITGRQVVTVSLDGKRDTLEIRDITCWVLNDNRWQLSVYQATPVK